MSDFEDRVRRDLHRSADRVEPPPVLWRRVEDRIGRPRDRRAIAVLAAAAVTVVAVAVLAVALHNNGESTKNVVTASPSTSDQGVVVPADQTTPTEPATRTTLAPASTAPATSMKPPLPTSTTTPPDCAVADLAYYATTDRTSYPNGDTVTIMVGARNVSSHPCNYKDGTCQWAQIVPEGGGQPVWDSRKQAHTDCLAVLTAGVLSPGQNREVSFTWDKYEYACPTPSTTTNPPPAIPPCAASPGMYRVNANADPANGEGSGDAVSTPFQVQ